MLNSYSSIGCSVRLQLVRMDYTEVIIEQRFHRHLIGKNGTNSEWEQPRLVQRHANTHTPKYMNFLCSESSERFVCFLGFKMADALPHVPFFSTSSSSSFSPCSQPDKGAVQGVGANPAGLWAQRPGPHWGGPQGSADGQEGAAGDGAEDGVYCRSSRRSGLPSSAGRRLKPFLVWFKRSKTKDGYSVHIWSYTKIMFFSQSL